MTETASKSIYLAGKIAKNDWRHNIVAGISDITIDGEHEWPRLRKAIFGCLDYVGPYFRNCSHGCAKDDASHGIISTCVGNYVYKSHGDPSTEQPVIVEQCLHAIKRADIVFAWIERSDCHGTLVELGYALALGKKIWLAFDPKARPPMLSNDDPDADYGAWEQEWQQSPEAELWFARHACDGLWVNNDTDVASDVLRRLCSEHGYLLESPIEIKFWEEWTKDRARFRLNLQQQFNVLGGRYRLDFAHLETKTAIELDGYDYHASKEQFIKDRERQRRLEADGWYVMRFAGSEVWRNPQACVQEVAALIERRSA